jgi:hypothetical protein
MVTSVYRLVHPVVNMVENDIRERMVDLMEAHPEGMTILSIAEGLKINRNTVTKYIYELSGAGIIIQRKVGSAKLCFLAKPQTAKAMIKARKEAKMPAFLPLMALLPLLLLAVAAQPALAVNAQSHPMSELTPIDANLNMLQYSVLNLTWLNSTSVNASNQICVGNVCRTSWVTTGNTTNEIFAAVDNNTFHRFSQLLNFSNLTTCASNQILKISGSAWTCQADTGGNTSAEIISAVNATNNGFYNITSWFSMYVNNATERALFTADQAGNTSAQMITAINNSLIYNLTSYNAYYVNNATERTLFTNTYNASYMTNTYNVSYNAQLGHNTTAEIQAAQLITGNTTNQIFAAVDNSTFHRFNQQITWANLSSWSLNNVWTGTLGIGNVTAIGGLTPLNFSADIGLRWENLTTYPTACGANQRITAIGDTLTCANDLFNTTAEIQTAQTGNTTAQIIAAINNTGLGAGNITLGTLTNARLDSKIHFINNTAQLLTAQNLTTGTINATHFVANLGLGVGNITGITGNVTGIGTQGNISMWFNTTALNASALYQNNGNIGIGTILPVKTLDVVGTINATSQICIAGVCASSWPIGNVTGGGSAGYMPVWYNATQLNASSIVVSSTWLNATSINASNQICVGNVCQTSWPAAGGNASSNGTANYVSKFASSTMLSNSQIIDNGTHVGIGTATPIAQLHVETTSRKALNITSTWNSNYNAVDILNARGDFQGFRYTASGGSGSYIANNVLFDDARPDTASTVGTFFSITRSGALTKSNVFGVGSDSTPDELVVNDTGYVGIGTTSPDKKLEIQTANGVESSLRIRQLTQNYWDFSVPASGTRLAIGDVGGEKVSILATSGNVGIGTTAPVKTLDVVGDINATQNIYEAGLTLSGKYLSTNGSAPGTYNLAGYWSFDEGSGSTLIDSSMNGNSGTAYGSPSWVVGKYGNALNFTGTNEITITDKEYLKYKGGNFTIALWVKPQLGDATAGYMVSKPWNGNGWYNYEVEWLSTDKIYVFVGGATQYTLTTDTVYTEDVWHHVVVTFGSDSSVRIYVDGSLSKSGTHSISSWTPGAPGDGNVRLAIANLYPQEPAQTQWMFNGTMDELRIYNTSLSVEDIRALYVSGADSRYSIVAGKICIGSDCRTTWPTSDAGNNMTGAGTAGYLTKWANGTAVNASGVFENNSNVGIGTTAPVTKLNVRGGDIGIQADNVLGSGKNYGDSVAAASGTIKLYNGGTGNLEISSPSYGVILQPTTGNVGIGTAGPGQLLHLRKNQNASTFMQIENLQTSASNNKAGIRLLTQLDWTGETYSTYYTDIYQDAHTGSLHLKHEVQSNPTMTWNSAGNVGIGTTSPSEKLTIQNTTASDKSTFWLADGGSGGGRILMQGTGTCPLGSASPCIEFGPGGSSGRDVNLYRSAANTLKTDDAMVVAGQLVVQVSGGKTTIDMQGSGADTGITMGSDTNIYRPAADTLKTDDSLVAAGAWMNGTSINASNQICLGNVCRSAWPATGNTSAEVNAAINSTFTGQLGKNTTEEIQDAAWNVLGGTQTLISVAYNDAGNAVNFVVTPTGNTTAQIQAAQTVNTSAQVRAAQTINTSAEVLAIAVSRTDWTTHDSYPAACGAGQVASAVGDTLTCIGLATGNNMTGAGTAGYMAKWANGTAVNASGIYELAGNVGIGTAGPAYKLDVSGDARVTGNLYLGGQKVLDSANSGLNMIKNPSFEAGTTGWDLSGEGYISLETSYGYYGKNMIKNTGRTSCCNQVLSQSVPGIKNSTAYTYSGWLYGPTASTQLYIRELPSYDSTGVCSGSQIIEHGTGSKNYPSWTRENKTFTTQSTTKCIIVQVFYYGDMSGGLLYVDGLQLEEGNQPTGFKDFTVNNLGNVTVSSGLNVLSGNVGIGTTGPDFKLDVSGDIRIESANKLYFGGTGAADNDVSLSRSAADTLSLGAGDSFAATTFSGDVTIGANKIKTTDGLIYDSGAGDILYFKNLANTDYKSIAAYHVYVAHDLIFSSWTGPDPEIRAPDTDNAELILKTRDNGVGLVEVARLQGAADPYFKAGSAVFLQSGNVGIGTSAPNRKLEVIGSINATDIIRNDAGGVNAHIMAGGNVYTKNNNFVFGESTSEGEYIYRTGDDIVMRAGGSDRLSVVGSTGNINLAQNLIVTGGTITIGADTSISRASANTLNVGDSGDTVQTVGGTGPTLSSSGINMNNKDITWTKDQYFNTNNAGIYFQTAAQATKGKIYQDGGNLIINTADYSAEIIPKGGVRPWSDNTYALGGPSFRWSNVYTNSTRTGNSEIYWDATNSRLVIKVT